MDAGARARGRLRFAEGLICLPVFHGESERPLMHPPLRFVLSLFLWLGASALASEPAIEPPRVIEQPMWNYPHAAASEFVFQGHARVLVSISEEGEVLDFIVLGFTHPAFAQEVVSSMSHFRFLPARVRGEPAATRIPITFNFEQQGNVVSMTASEQVERHLARFSRFGEFKPTVCPGRELDEPLVATTVVSPLYPMELRARAVEGEVTVDFYVDPEGRVRMPATAVNAHPSFARMAMGAIEQWRFAPPTSGGEPVLVHVRQLFRFMPPTDLQPVSRASSGAPVASADTADGTLPAVRF